jgi:hypothetical protein
MSRENHVRAESLAPNSAEDWSEYRFESRKDPYAGLRVALRRSDVSRDSAFVVR